MGRLEADYFELTINPESMWDLNRIANIVSSYDVHSVKGWGDSGTLILKDRRKGLTILGETIDFMHMVGADFLVSHAWDPQATFNLEDLIVLENCRDSITIENIPSFCPIKGLLTSLKNCT